MNIAVIGSGASAFGVLLRLKEELKKSDIKVTVFSKDLNYINNIFLENASITKSKLNLNRSVNLHKNIRHNFGHTFNEIKIENSNNLIYDIPYSGGLSDIWSGSAALPLDQDLKNSISKAYQLADIIDFEGKYYRTDIGIKVFKYFEEKE